MLLNVISYIPMWYDAGQEKESNDSATGKVVKIAYRIHAQNPKLIFT